MFVMLEEKLATSRKLHVILLNFPHHVFGSKFYSGDFMMAFFSFAISGDLSSVHHTVVLFIFSASFRLILRHPFVEVEVALIMLRLSLTDSLFLDAP